MMPGWVSFAEVKAAVSMRLVLEGYGVLEKLRRSGRERYRGRCPIHPGEGQDAFHAHLGKNLFHGFAYGAGGNVLDLVAALEQCTAGGGATFAAAVCGESLGAAAGAGKRPTGYGKKRGECGPSFFSPWLRDGAKITSQIRANRIVPSRKHVGVGDAE